MLVIEYLRITKTQVKDVNLDTIIVTLWQYKTGQHSGYNHAYAKQKLLRKRRTAFTSSRSRRGKNVTHTAHSQEFWQTCEDLSWNHCTSKPHRSETNGIAERAVRGIKEGTSAVLLQSSLDERWCVTAIFETSQIYYLMGTRPMKDVLGNHLKDRLFHLVHWLSITLFLRKISQESINLERKSYLDCSSDTHCTRSEFGRVTYWLQILRSWKRWTHRKSTQKDSMRKR